MTEIHELRVGGRVTLVLALTCGLILLGPAASTARAELVSTRAALAASTARADREALQRLVARPEVTQELERLGVEPREARARVAALSDAEVAEVAGRLSDLPAGGGAVGAIVGAALVVFLVLLLTDILGLTDVFPWVVKRPR